MPHLILDNLANILIGGLLLAGIFFSLRHVVAKFHAGQCAGCGGCGSDCPAKRKKSRI
ncbi:MAG: FeoB-associated Cys-rich membrane protein [Clostridiales Family XIII bacterium]|jgi:ferredoxin|nr:FeoB-associated Cys-rich membrane protein [Clostridiales Family XIII bacterium]